MQRSRSTKLRRPCSTAIVVSVLAAVTQPGLLDRVGGRGNNHTGEEGAAERGTPAARPGNDRVRVGAPVRRAQPQRACQIGEDVDDHDHPPDAEADRVHGKQRSTAMPGDDQRDSASKERQRRGDQKRGKQQQQKLRRPFEPVRLVAV
jgi:hypothetical protein